MTRRRAHRASVIIGARAPIRRTAAVAIITIGYLNAHRWTSVSTIAGRPKTLKAEKVTLRRLHLLAGLVISAGALYLALRGVHWGEVGDAIGGADLLLILTAAGLLIATLGLRAVRWRVLLYSVPGLRLWHLFGSLNVGYFMNNVLPFQVGELGRAYMLSELASISTMRSLSTVVVERVVDVLTLLLFLLLLAPFVPIPVEARIPAILLALAAIAAALALVAASQRRGPVLSIIERLLSLAPAGSRPKLRQMADNAVGGFAVLANPRMGLTVALLSVVAWTAIGLVYYLAFQAFGIELGFEAALLVVVATTFGFLFPSSPGSFGVYHAIAIATLTGVFDIDKNIAISYALVVHLVFYVPPILIGLAFLWLERRMWQRTSFFGKLAELRGDMQLKAAEEA